MTRFRPSRRASSLVILAVLAGGAVAACGAPSGGPPSWTFAPGPSAPGTSAPVTSAPVTATPTSPIEGVVVRVETTGLNDFRGFQLRTDTGDVHVFTLGRLENATEFPPNHLPEHMAAADRLRVSFELVSGALVVYRIDHAYEDASPG